MKHVFTLALVLFSQVSIASSPTNSCDHLRKAFSQIPAKNTVCLCQTGSDVREKNEVPWFIRGCNLWLKGQSGCSKKQVIAFNEGLEVPGLIPIGTQHIKLGYVGHWDHGYYSIDWLLSDITPIIRDKGISFEIDNTACRATEDPGELADYIRLLAKDYDFSNKILFKGNQAISTGLWDKFRIAKTNFPATVCGQGVELPNCKQLEGKNCSKSQVKEKAYCVDSSRQVSQLQCKQSTNSFRIGRGSSTGYARKWQVIKRISKSRYRIESLNIADEAHYIVSVEPEYPQRNEENFNFLGYATVYIPESKIADQAYIDSKILADIHVLYIAEEIQDAFEAGLVLKEYERTLVPKETYHNLFRVQFESEDLRERYFHTKAEAQSYVQSYSVFENIFEMDKTEADDSDMKWEFE